MANKTLNSRIIIRNDTEAEWKSANPVLMKGEIGISSDLVPVAFKVGDGTKKWTELAYAYNLAEILSQVDEKIEAAVGDLHQAQVYQAEVEHGSDKLGALQGVAESPAQGDIGIVKEAISDDHVQYTAYVYDGSAWAAMDGNYDAANVYFAKNLVFTQAFGKYAPGSSGSVEIPTAANGMSLQALLEGAFAEEKNPTITQPSTSVTLTGAGAKEVGTEFTPSYSVGFNAGNYQYGPATGVTATAYAVTDTNSGSASTQTGSFTKFTVGDDTNYKVSVTTSHSAGAVPKTNLGNDYAAGQIQAGTKTASSSAVTGFRNEFYGTMTTKPGTMTSADIRGLTGKKAQAVGTISVSVPVGALRVVIAVPSSKVVNSVLDVNGLNAQIFSSFTNVKVQVEGANSYTAIEYNVYYLDYANANDTANTYTVTIANA